MSRASDRAYSSIRNMILSGELPAGTQLGEEALAEKCGVSRTPVREALRRLETDMLVARTDTQRSYVPEWSLDDVRDALAAAEGAAMTISRVGLAATSPACPGAPLVYEFGEKVQLEITVAEPDLAAAIAAILRATREAGDDRSH